MTPPALALWGLAVASLALGLHARRAGRPAASTARPAPLPAWLRLAARLPAPAPLRRLAVRPDPAAAVASAGLGDAFSPDALVRARAGAGLAGLAAGLAAGALAPALLLLAPLGLAAGAILPDRALRARARRRRAQVVRELPDLLDLLGITVEAGMPLDAALHLAGERIGGIIGAEVGRTLRDLALGTPRRTAYRDLAARVGAPELAEVVGALLQAEELGAPLAAALSGQGATLRAARRQAARDRAARAAPRIQLVVALVMVPGALLLVLGVMLIELARQVGAVAGGG